MPRYTTKSMRQFLMERHTKNKMKPKLYKSKHLLIQSHNKKKVKSVTDNMKRHYYGEGKLMVRTGNIRDFTNVADEEIVDFIRKNDPYLEKDYVDSLTREQKIKLANKIQSPLKKEIDDTSMPSIIKFKIKKYAGSTINGAANAAYNTTNHMIKNEKYYKYIENIYLNKPKLYNKYGLGKKGIKDYTYENIEKILNKLLDLHDRKLDMGRAFVKYFLKDALIPSSEIDNLSYNELEDLYDRYLNFINNKLPQLNDDDTHYIIINKEDSKYGKVIPYTVETTGHHQRQVSKFILSRLTDQKKEGNAPFVSSSFKPKHITAEQVKQTI